jgi:hypothetical protein
LIAIVETVRRWRLIVVLGKQYSVAWCYVSRCPQIPNTVHKVRLTEHSHCIVESVVFETDKMQRWVRLVQPVQRGWGRDFQTTHNRAQVAFWTVTATWTNHGTPPFFQLHLASSRIIVALSGCYLQFCAIGVRARALINKAIRLSSFYAAVRRGSLP